MGTRIFTLALALCLPLGARTQQDESSQPQESTAPPEEIVVTGDSAMVQLRTQMMAAEQKAYDIFNQFNDERRFHISCRMHQPTGTRIASGTGH